MSAFLVFDNANPNVIVLPPQLGSPKEDQLQGTCTEQLIEIAGRTCYDSLGTPKSRGSLEYHQHIVEVNHGSVLEHANLVFEFDKDFIRTEEKYCSFFNRPGLWWRGIKSRLTINVRALVEWCQWCNCDRCQLVGTAMYQACPHVIPFYSGVLLGRLVGESDKGLPVVPANCCRLVGPQHEEERWISLYLVGSRGWSHEQVRHKFRTAVSQRSTRFCDESSTEYCIHPLLRDYMAMMDDDSLRDKIMENIKSSRELYDVIVDKLQAYQSTFVHDRLTARKQARGAARGFLGNALETQMVFSASVAQWQRILKQRNNRAADGEIFEMYHDDVFPIITEIIGEAI